MQQYFLALTAGIKEHLIKRTPGSKAKSKSLFNSSVSLIGRGLAAGAVVSSKNESLLAGALVSRRTSRAQPQLWINERTPLASVQP